MNNPESTPNFPTDPQALLAEVQAAIARLEGSVDPSNIKALQGMEESEDMRRLRERKRFLEEALSGSTGNAPSSGLTH